MQEPRGITPPHAAPGMRKPSSAGLAQPRKAGAAGSRQPNPAPGARHPALRPRAAAAAAARLRPWTAGLPPRAAYGQRPVSRSQPAGAAAASGLKRAGEGPRARPGGHSMPLPLHQLAGYAQQQPVEAGEADGEEDSKPLLELPPALRAALKQAAVLAVLKAQEVCACVCVCAYDHQPGFIVLRFLYPRCT